MSTHSVCNNLSEAGFITEIRSDKTVKNLRLQFGTSNTNDDYNQITYFNNPFQSSPSLPDNAEIKAACFGAGMGMFSPFTDTQITLLSSRSGALSSDVKSN